VGELAHRGVVADAAGELEGLSVLRERLGLARHDRSVRCQCRLRLSLRGLQFGDSPESVEVVGLRREHGPACGESGVGAVEADGQ